MRTAAYKVDFASDRRRRENVPRHILCSPCAINTHISTPESAPSAMFFLLRKGSL